jgi:hypothetical protein
LDICAREIMESHIYPNIVAWATEKWRLPSSKIEARRKANLVDEDFAYFSPQREIYI